jgi:hypothetical protein
MRVRINNKSVKIFSGARVRDVLIKYSQKSYKRVLKSKYIVVDENGNSVDVDGELSDGLNLFIKKKTWGGVE